MDVAPVYGDDGLVGAEGLFVQLAQLVAIDGVGKTGASCNLFVQKEMFQGIKGPS